MSNLDEFAKLLGAAGHPTRLRILLALRDGEASAKGTTKRLEDQTLGRVAHHFRALAHAGLIQRTRTRPVRGAAENFYVLTADALDLLDKLDLVDAEPPEAESFPD